MKAFNLTARINPISISFSNRGMHNVQVIQSLSNYYDDVYYAHMPACSKQAEAEGYDILVVSEKQWDICRYSLEKNFLGAIYLVPKRGGLLNVASNRRGTKTDFNYFGFKQIEEVENQLDMDTSKCNPDKAPCLFK